MGTPAVEVTPDHRDDGQCHEACWQAATAEHEVAERERLGIEDDEAHFFDFITGDQV